jgi:ABC-type glycerol-3-phosphate transport system substrate-binding protein
MKKKLLSLVLVGMFALGAVACGGDDAGTDTGTDTDAGTTDTATEMTS